jgi:hypothetical protein
VAALNREEKEIVKREWAKQWRIIKTGQTLRALVPEITKKTLEIYKGLPMSVILWMLKTHITSTLRVVVLR